MDVSTEVAKIVTGDNTGTIGWAIGAIATTALAIRQWLEKNKGDSAIVLAVKEDNARLENRAREAEAAQKQTEIERDNIAKERNDLIREFSDIRAMLAETKTRLEFVTKQNEQLIEQNARLTKQIEQFLGRGDK